MMPLFDAHIHLFANGYRGEYGTLFPRGQELVVYEAIRRAHRIERALVIGYEGAPWAQDNNRYIARLSRERPWIVPLAFCSCSAAPSTRQLEAWWKAGFSGIALYAAEASELRILLAWPEAVFTTLNEKRAIISLNVPADRFPCLRPFFLRLPETSILASHLGLPKGVTGKTITSFPKRTLAPLLHQADLPHLGVKLSGFYAYGDYPHAKIVPVLKMLRQAFGEKRLYWGSDFSPLLDKASFTQSIHAARVVPWEPLQSKAIFHKNLSRIIERVS